MTKASYVMDLFIIKNIINLYFISIVTLMFILLWSINNN